MRKRTRSRELALQIFYQMDMSGAPWEEAWADSAQKESPAVREYAQRLVKGTWENVEEIDALIERTAENWDLSRMAIIDRNILRIATYEIIYEGELPVKVALNEAVELAKRYGQDDSSKFVNGILDRIAKCKK